MFLTVVMSRCWRAIARLTSQPTIYSMQNVHRVQTWRWWEKKCHIRPSAVVGGDERTTRGGRRGAFSMSTKRYDPIFITVDILQSLTNNITPSFFVTAHHPPWLWGELSASAALQISLHALPANKKRSLIVINSRNELFENRNRNSNMFRAGPTRQIAFYLV